MAPRDEKADTCRCLMNGCLCCYTAWDCFNPLFFCKQSCDCLCYRESCCLAINTPHKGCGITTDENRKECCKLGLFCLDCGLVWPQTVCGCAEQCCCCYAVGNFPCSDEFIPQPVCAFCLPFLSCSPKCGCCVAPPPCPALDKMRNEAEPLMEMDRGGTEEGMPASLKKETSFAKGQDNKQAIDKLKVKMQQKKMSTAVESKELGAKNDSFKLVSPTSTAQEDEDDSFKLVSPTRTALEDDADDDSDGSSELSC